MSTEPNSSSKAQKKLPFYSKIYLDLILIRDFLIQLLLREPKQNFFYITQIFERKMSLFNKKKIDCLKGFTYIYVFGFKKILTRIK